MHHLGDKKAKTSALQRDQKRLVYTELNMGDQDLEMKIHIVLNDRFNHTVSNMNIL